MSRRQRRPPSPSSSSDEMLVINMEDLESEIHDSEIERLLDQVSSLSITPAQSKKRSREEALIPPTSRFTSNRVVKLQTPYSKNQVQSIDSNKEETKDENIQNSKALRKSIKLQLKVKNNRKSIAKMTPEVQKQTCAICLDEIPILQQVSLDKCTHVYCRECILKWTTDCSNQCPQCKSDIDFIIYKNVAGDEVRQPVEERRLGDLILKCETCQLRIRENDLFRRQMPPSPNEAALCDICEEHAIHLRCMITEDQIDYATDDIWNCVECLQLLSSESDESESESDDESIRQYLVRQGIDLTNLIFPRRSDSLDIDFNLRLMSVSQNRRQRVIPHNQHRPQLVNQAEQNENQIQLRANQIQQRPRQNLQQSSGNSAIPRPQQNGQSVQSRQAQQRATSSNQNRNQNSRGRGNESRAGRGRGNQRGGR